MLLGVFKHKTKFPKTRFKNRCLPWGKMQGKQVNKDYKP